MPGGSSARGRGRGLRGLRGLPPSVSSGSGRGAGSAPPNTGSGGPQSHHPPGGSSRLDDFQRVLTEILETQGAQINDALDAQNIMVQTLLQFVQTSHASASAAAAQQASAAATAAATAANATNHMHNAPPPAPFTRVRMPEPPVFDGSDKRKTLPFLRACLNVFECDRATFASLEQRFRYTFQLIVGDRVDGWIGDKKDLLNANMLPYASWPLFEQDFLLQFGDPLTKTNAQAQILTIRQGTTPATEFMLRFDELKRDSNFDLEAVITCLEMAIHPSIARLINQIQPRPITYEEWRRRVIEIDNDQRRQRTRTTTAWTLAIPTAPARFTRRFAPSTAPAATASIPAPGTTIHATTTTASTPTPTTAPSPAPATGSNTTTQRKCWLCGSTSHLSKTCPSKTTSSRIRAVVDNLDALEIARDAVLDAVNDGLAEEDPELFERIVNDPLFVPEDE